MNICGYAILKLSNYEEFGMQLRDPPCPEGVPAFEPESPIEPVRMERVPADEASRTAAAELGPAGRNRIERIFKRRRSVRGNTKHPTFG